MFKWQCGQLDYSDAVYVHVRLLVSFHSSVQSQVCGAESRISIVHLRMVGACPLTPPGKRLVQRLNEHLVILLLLDHLQVRSGQLLK